MKKIRLKIRQVAGQFGCGGLELFQGEAGKEYDLYRRTPMLRPGQIVELDEDHPVAARDYKHAHLLEITDEEPNRPATFANAYDLEAYKKAAPSELRRAIQDAIVNAKRAEAGGQLMQPSATLSSIEEQQRRLAEERAKLDAEREEFEQTQLKQATFNAVNVPDDSADIGLAPATDTNAVVRGGAAEDEQAPKPNKRRGRK